MTSVLVMQLWPHVISWCSLFWFCASKKGGVDGSGQAKSWHTVHMVAVLAGCRKTMVSFVPRRHLRERVWWHLGWLLSGEKFLSAKSHCRKNNLQCTTGNSWLLQQGDTALFWRVNLLSVLNYVYGKPWIFNEAQEISWSHQTLSSRVGSGDETSPWLALAGAFLSFLAQMSVTESDVISILDKPVHWTCM